MPAAVCYEGALSGAFQCPAGGRPPARATGNYYPCVGTSSSSLHNCTLQNVWTKVMVNGSCALGGGGWRLRSGAVRGGGGGGVVWDAPGTIFVWGCVVVGGGALYGGGGWVDH